MNKPRIFYWLGGWYCGDPRTWHITPNQQPNGSATPLEAYNKYMSHKEPVSVWQRIKNLFNNKGE